MKLLATIFIGLLIVNALVAMKRNSDAMIRASYQESERQKDDYIHAAHIEANRRAAGFAPQPFNVPVPNAWR